MATFASCFYLVVWASTASAIRLPEAHVTVKMMVDSESPAFALHAVSMSENEGKDCSPELDMLLLIIYLDHFNQSLPIEAQPLWL